MTSIPSAWTALDGGAASSIVLSDLPPRVLAGRRAGSCPPAVPARPGEYHLKPFPFNGGQAFYQSAECRVGGNVLVADLLVSQAAPACV